MNNSSTIQKMRSLKLKGMADCFEAIAKTISINVLGTGMTLKLKPKGRNYFSLLKSALNGAKALNLEEW